MQDEHSIQTTTELESVIGEPFEQVREKIYQSLDDAMVEFIRRSPLMFLATWDARGQPDVSPKGDAPGFVHIDADDGDLLIPDRPGNRLLFGFRNILKNNNVGAIFVVPRMRETLRIKGRASLSKDPALLEQLSARNKPALLCTRIAIDECFFHCGKAMIRSHLWKPQAWDEQHESLMLRSIAQRYNADADGKKEIETDIESGYRDNLY